MAKKAFEDELEAQLLKLTSPDVQALVTKALAPVETVEEAGGPTCESDLEVLPASPTSKSDLQVQVLPASPTFKSMQSDLEVLPASPTSKSDLQVGLTTPESIEPNLVKHRARPLTKNQQRVFDYLLRQGAHITDKCILAEATGLSPFTVKTILVRLTALGLLERKRVGQGSRLVAKIPGEARQQSPTFKSDFQVQPSSPTFKSDLPPSKIDRENLSISLTSERITLTWPNLAATGFGAHQIEQISQALAELGKPADRIVQSLDHAEWELERGQMLDKKGRPVADPCSWVFTALARTGYYRRPKDYVSPEEQADIDAATEAQARARSREIAREARFQAWVKGLSPSDRENALEGRQGPSEAWLKNVWVKRGEPE